MSGMGVFGVEDFGDLGVAQSGDGRSGRRACRWERAADGWRLGACAFRAAQAVLDKCGHKLFHFDALPCGACF